MGARLSSPALVGRAREQRLLVEALGSRPALILVEGEAGVGKTRLVHETLASEELTRLRVLTGHCHQLREPFLLGPVVEALRCLRGQPEPGPLSPVVGALRPLLPELSDLLPPQPPVVGDPRVERHRIFRAVRELLGAVGPTVSVFEDVHWADEGTLELLEFVMTQPPEALALVLTYRPEDLPPASPLPGLSGLGQEVTKVMIELQPLSVSEVQTLIGEILELEEAPEDLARQLHTRTGGIPFLLEEVIRLLRDRNQLTIVGGMPAIVDFEAADVPPAVRQAIRQRMEPLAADPRRVVQAAAVLGAAGGEDLLAAIAGVPAARAMRALVAVTAAALLEARADGSYDFRHALARQAVYDEIPVPERRRMHRRAAGALATVVEPPPHAQLAHHYLLAERPRQWAEHTEAAAAIATSIGDDRAAVRLLEPGLSAAGLPRAAKVRLAIRLASAAPHSDRPERYVGLLQQILADKRMPVGLRGELRLAIARLRYYVGDEGRWQAEIARAVGELQRRPQLAARAMLLLAWPMVTEGDVAENLAWLERAVETANQTDDPLTKHAVYTQRAAILLSVGDPDGWQAFSDLPSEGLSVPEKLQLLSAYQSLAGVVRALGHHRRAEDLLTRITALSDELDHVWWSPWIATARVAQDWCTGQWEGLEARARKLVEERPGTATLAVGTELVLGALLFVRGRIDEAERMFRSVLERAQARRWLGARVAASAWLAQVQLAAGDAQAARQTATVGVDLVRNKRIWIWGREVVPVAVEALLASGRRGDAEPLANQFAAGVETRISANARAASCVIRGALAEEAGGYRAAAELFESADEKWSELPSPYEAARARERRGRCLLAEGDEAGGDVLKDALSVYERLDASPAATRVRTELKARGVSLPAPSRGGRRSYGDELSPREAEVVELVRSGKKNREIAAALFLSPRTVEAHVASAIRKLGVASRQELAAADDADRA